MIFLLILFTSKRKELENIPNYVFTMSTILISKKGFNSLDFNEIKHVAGLVGFDIAACAQKKKSCGPGCDWLVQDKRYFTLMLLKHIDQLVHEKAAIPPEVLSWQKIARMAADEYRSMEEKLYPVLKRQRNS